MPPTTAIRDDGGYASGVVRKKKQGGSGRASLFRIPFFSGGGEGFGGIFAESIPEAAEAGQ